MSGAIPIIGRTRDWKDVTFAYAGVGRPPAILAPGAQPEIVAFQIGFIGTRSDEMPVQCFSVIELDKLAQSNNPIVAILKIVQATLSNFETFRTCACLPTAPCSLHTQSVAGEPA